MARLIVLGAGLGGLPAALELKSRFGKKHEIKLINNATTFQFVPSNPWVAVGWRRPDKIVVDLEKVMRRKGIHFVAQGAKEVKPADNQILLEDGSRINYDYLVITTGPKLAFEDIEGLGPEAGFTQSICTLGHAEKALEAYRKFLADPGPVVVGAVQGASCFGPAYEYALILDRDLRQHKLRSKVPITFVTSEPYIGHLGLGGVGDSNGMLETALRERDIKWISNTKIERIEDGKMHVIEHDESGAPKRDIDLPFKFSMLLPSFRGVDAVAAAAELCNAKGFVQIDDYQRNPRYPNIYSAGVCVAIPPRGSDSRSHRSAQDRLHDRINGYGHRGQHRSRHGRQRPRVPGDMECHLPRRHGQQGHRLCRAPPDPAPERHLGKRRTLGALGQGYVLVLLHVQDAPRQKRGGLRT